MRAFDRPGRSTAYGDVRHGRDLRPAGHAGRHRHAAGPAAMRWMPPSRLRRALRRRTGHDRYRRGLLRPDRHAGWQGAGPQRLRPVGPGGRCRLAQGLGPHRASRPAAFMPSPFQAPSTAGTSCSRAYGTMVARRGLAPAIGMAEAGTSRHPARRPGLARRCAGSPGRRRGSAALPEEWTAPQEGDDHRLSGPGPDIAAHRPGGP